MQYRYKTDHKRLNGIGFPMLKWKTGLGPSMYSNKKTAIMIEIIPGIGTLGEKLYALLPKQTKCPQAMRSISQRALHKSLNSFLRSVCVQRCRVSFPLVALTLRDGSPVAEKLPQKDKWRLPPILQEVSSARQPSDIGIFQFLYEECRCRKS